MIPLLLKVYKNGTLPNMLINHKADCLKLSPPKGLGLRLAELEKGTILILAGGTGLYPFSDIIDLLYKNYKLTTSPHLKEFIYIGNSILRNNPFAKFNFKLLFSC
jgi:NAD(P)H-flavin reductase